MEGSGLQWSFSKKTGSTSQILSFRSSQSAVYPPPPGSSPSTQRKSPIDIKSGNYNKYPVKTHLDAPVSLSREISYSSSPSSSLNQSHKYFSNGLSSPHHVVVNQSPAVVQNVIKSGMNIGRTQLQTSSYNYKPVATSIAPAKASAGNSPVVGSTDLSGERPSCGPSQMTIFYNGLVCVYDDIAPEKAQAIMLLAGNGKPTNMVNPMANPAAPTRSRPPPPPPPSPTSPIFVDLTTTTSLPSSGLTNPAISPNSTISTKGAPVKRSSSAGQLTPESIVLNSGVASRPSSSSQSPATAALQPISISPSVSVIRPVPVAIPMDLLPSTTCPVIPISMASPPPMTTTTHVTVRGAAEPAPKAPTGASTTSPGAARLTFHQSGLPQARSASLQRFLEKRKERVVMTGSPYGNVSKGSSEYSNKGTDDFKLISLTSQSQSQSFEAAAAATR